MTDDDAPDGQTAAVTAIYSDAYAERYPALYIAPWGRKHRLNVANLGRILDGLGPRPHWVDLACGQAWHFSRFPGRAEAIGVDISPAQLSRARRNAPDARFVRADLARLQLADRSVDLVSNFWAGYCYLGTAERIAGLVRRAVGWIRPGGALYMEVLLPRDLESFNRSRYASQTGFAVAPFTADDGAWQYDDVGGHHVMFSPPIEMFLELVTGQFEDVESTHDGGFMVHLIATGRR